MSINTQTLKRTGLAMVAGALLLSASGFGRDNSNSGQPIKHVTAGEGLVGGGDGPSVTLSVANGGITISMLAPSTITSLQGATGPQGPAGAQGPAGPQGPAGAPGGGDSSAIYRHVLTFGPSDLTVLDGSPFGLTSSSDGFQTFSSAVPGLRKHVHFVAPAPVVLSINSNILTFQGDNVSEECVTLYRLADGANNTIASNISLANTFSDRQIAAGFIELPAGTYNLDIYMLAQAAQTISDFSFVAPDATILNGTAKVVVEPANG